MAEFDIDQHIGLADLQAPSDGASSRVEKARTEKSLVVPVADEYGHCTGEYHVFSQSGSHYEVGIDGRETCNCMDMRMYSPSSGCKHINRVGIQMTEGSLPQPDEPVDEYLAWLADQLDALRDAREELEDDGDSDDLDAVETAIETLEDVFDGDYEALSDTLRNGEALEVVQYSP